jgi:hypothetical protein
MRNRLPVAQLREPLWKRQPGETVIAYASFRAFRDLKPGERSIARVCRELGKNVTMMEDRALRWRWRERAMAHDERLDAIALDAIVSPSASRREPERFRC